MLSRVAESLFWIGRYLERADGTARILDVHLQLVLEDPTVDEDAACRSLLAIMGHEDLHPEPLTSADVLEILGVSRTHPPSIAFSLVSARENGRRARETISTELWECLNAVTISMPRQVPKDRIHAFFQWVRERTAMASGIADTTMSRDEGYQFFRLGQSLERADMTARLLATRALTETHAPSWTTILRSCGAYEACLRTFRGLPTTRDAAEFLLLDRLFPRSVYFSLNRALAALDWLDPASGRVGADSSSAKRVLGHQISTLQYQSVDEILADLPGHMDGIQLATSGAANHVKEKFFPTHAVPTWVGESA